MKLNNTATTVEEKHDPWKGFMEQYPILYSRRSLPMTQTCMCWGIDCGAGWKEPLTDLSVRLEALNVLCRKYGVEILAEQVKQKYGTLRVYFNVNCRATWYGNVLAFPIFVIERIWRGIKNTIKRCLVLPSKRHITDYPHGFLADAAWIVKGLRFNKRKQQLIGNWLNIEADRLVKVAEEACHKRCETCGREIGTAWSPRCETEGWVSYVCEKCAKEATVAYLMQVPNRNEGEWVTPEEWEEKKNAEKEASEQKVSRVSKSTKKATTKTIKTTTEKKQPLTQKKKTSSTGNKTTKKQNPKKEKSDAKQE